MPFQSYSGAVRTQCDAAAPALTAQQQLLPTPRRGERPHRAERARFWQYTPIAAALVLALALATQVVAQPSGESGASPAADTAEGPVSTPGSAPPAAPSSVSAPAADSGAETTDATEISTEPRIEPSLSTQLVESKIAELRLSYRDYGQAGRDDVGFRLARYAE